MDDQAYRSLQNQLDSLRREFHEFRAYSPLDLLTAIRGWPDDFAGDQLDPRWNPTATGVGAVVPALQASSPSRVLFDTGVATIGATSQMDEGVFYKWKAADRISGISVAKISTLTNIAASLYLLWDGTANNLVQVGFDTTVDATRFWFRCISGGVASATSFIGTADTSYHTFAISVRTGVARVRMDGGIITEITSNVPTADLALRYQVVNRTVAASKQLELDFSWIIPGLNSF